ncbi:alpha/beta hydrolase [Streptomyces sp. NPDC051954]|uniref:alpha/beta hydrolase n=1 Tax=Streptomyces sp. NPDC051954 TaxID=3155524 RepID=UPI003442550E
MVPGYRPLALDLYTPVGKGPFPVIVYLHGGGWRLGSRREFGPAFDGLTPDPWTTLTRAGFAVASVDYRLSGEAPFPAQVHDVKAAVRWLRHRHGELNLDAEHIVAFGESAGGHLAALLGLTPDHAELEGTVGVTGPSSRVTAVIDWYAPTDLLALSRHTPPAPPGGAGQPSREALLLGNQAQQVPHLARLASPVAHVSAAAPPFHIAHGADDRLVPSGQSQALTTALRSAGVPVDLHLVEGAGHLWTGADDATPLLDTAIKFAQAVTP